MHTLAKDLLDGLSSRIAEGMGLHYPPERWDDLERGLGHAAQALGLDSLESCARWLLLAPMSRSLIEVLASSLTVGETYFFRDKAVFDLLESRLLPAMIRDRSGKSQLRIWSAGCATGEEPYSIAILLNKLIPNIKDWNITILATDINQQFLQRAGRAVYGEWSFRDVPGWVKARWFRQTGPGRYTPATNIRDAVVFASHNLADDTYPSPSNNTSGMDIIFCRNVLMYFSDERRREVVQRLGRCLVEGGLLVVSPAELSVHRYSNHNWRSYTEAAIYRKEPPGDMPRPAMPSEEARGRKPTGPAIFRNPDHKPASTSLPAPRQVAPADRETAPPRPDLLREARIAYEQGLLDEAEKKIGLLLADDCERAPALALLSRIRANRGRLAEACELCRQAILSDKLNAGYHYLLATIFQEQGEVAEAVVSFSRAVYLDQNFVLAHLALGTIALQRGKTKEALRHFKNARSALRQCQPDEGLLESEGITAKRLEEIIATSLLEGNRHEGRTSSS